MSILSTLSLWIGICSWGIKSEHIIDEVDKNTTSPKDFSIELHGLPPDTQDGQLIAFIDNLVGNKLFNDTIDLTN